MKGRHVSRKSQRHLRKEFLKYDPPPASRRPAYFPPGPNAIKTGCSPELYQAKCAVRSAFRTATGVDIPVGQTNAALFVVWAIAVYNRSYINLQQKMISQASDERKRLNHRHRNRGRKAA